MTSNKVIKNNTEYKYSAYFPGCLASLCALQTRYYATSWGFNHLYEAAVSESISEFLMRYDCAEHFVRIVMNEDRVVGGIVIDNQLNQPSQLHWFILSDELRGQGFGRKLMTEAMHFVKEKRIEKVFLTTFEGLNSARKLYEGYGFKLTSEKLESTWGKEVNEQRFDYTLSH